MKIALLLSALTLSLALPRSQGNKPQEPPPLAVGSAAPAFRLNDHHGQTIAIGGKRETWTILAFYPKALTPG